MPDEFFTRPAPGLATPAARRGGAFRAWLGGVLLALIGAGALAGYLVWDGQIELRPDPAAPVRAVAAPAAPAGPSLATTNALAQQVAALEARLAQLDRQAASVGATTGRAEALLIAAATRRAVERGGDLGALGQQLQDRFGAAQPAAVATLQAAGRDPVTLDRLGADLEALAPRLTRQPARDSGWDQFRRQLGALFVIHRDNAVTVAPEDRLERARLQLRTGQVDRAASEVAALPAVSGAEAWLAAARRYAEVQQALATIETAALAAPAAAPAPPQSQQALQPQQAPAA